MAIAATLVFIGIGDARDAALVEAPGLLVCRCTGAAPGAYWVTLRVF